MSHFQTTDDTPGQPIRTRGRLEDGAVGLHAGRLRGQREGHPKPETPPLPRSARREHPDRGPETPARRGPATPALGGGGRLLLPLVAAGVAGATAGLWRLTRAGRRSAPPPAPSLPAPAQSWPWRGHRIAAYRRGEGPPVVLVHSIHAAASAREMAQPFERLAADRTVHAYDLLGFGASDRPPLAYRAELYVDLLGDFLAEMVGEPADVVASSLSAGHALHAARRWPERFRSLVMVNPTGLVTLANGRGVRGRLLEAAFRAPLLGEALFGALVSRPSLAWYDRKAYGDPRLVDREHLDHQWATAHQPNARFAPAAFVGRALAIDVARDLELLTVPALAIWTPPSGFQDTDAESRAFAELNPHLASRTIDDCGALPHEERPADFEAVVREWWEGRGEGERPPTPAEPADAPV
jgi:pimeloyl-ACP methyl ester carboxylesterase